MTNPWDWSRQEAAAYTALESRGTDLSITERNLRNAGMSRNDRRSVMQAVVDTTQIERAILRNIRNDD